MKYLEKRLYPLGYHPSKNRVMKTDPYIPDYAHWYMPEPNICPSCGRCKTCGHTPQRVEYITNTTDLG